MEGNDHHHQDEPALAQFMLFVFLLVTLECLRDRAQKGRKRSKERNKQLYFIISFFHITMVNPRKYSLYHLWTETFPREGYDTSMIKWKYFFLFSKPGFPSLVRNREEFNVCSVHPAGCSCLNQPNNGYKQQPLTQL